MPHLSIRDLDLNGKRVFIRVDFNVPLQKNEKGDMEITSDKRIKASLPTIQYALEHGAGVILASHLGRPKGKPNPEMSLKPAAARLQELLGRPVTMAPDCIGPEVEALKPAPGQVLLLENLRFHPEEEKNDPEFARKLAGLCDVYVNDAFGSAHRAHASTEGMIQFVPNAAAGLLMDQELKYLGMAVSNPARPCVAILGGAKVSDKIEVIRNLGKVVDRLLIGGAMAYTFLKAQGKPTGNSLVEAAAGSRSGFGDRRGRRQRGGRDYPRGQDWRRYRAPDHRGVRAGHRGRQDGHLERPHGNLREAPVRQGHGGASQGRGGFGRNLGGGRRRFRKGHQSRRRHRQDHARFYGWRGLPGVSGGDSTAGRCRSKSLGRRAATPQEFDIQVGTPKRGSTHFITAM
jgi:hypothetical protein